ncbi:MAG: hypothetical protein AB1700_00145 [Bacillota bacterium]|jgi:hypothetical protein
MLAKCSNTVPQTSSGEGVELVRKSKEQAGALVSALQAHVMFLSEQLEKAVALLPAAAMYEKYAADLREYGGIESPEALIDKVVITPEREKELASLIRGKVKEWAEGHPTLASLAPTVFGYVYGQFRRNFGCRRLSRILPQEYQEIVEFVKTLRIPSLADFGPLAAVLMVNRAMLQLSAARAAKMCGVTSRAFRRWETGVDVPSSRNIPALAQFLGMSEWKVENLAEQQRLFNGEQKAEKADRKPSRRPAPQVKAERGVQVGETLSP